MSNYMQLIDGVVEFDCVLTSFLSAGSISKKEVLESNSDSENNYLSLQFYQFFPYGYGPRVEFRRREQSSQK